MKRREFLATLGLSPLLLTAKAAAGPAVSGSNSVVPDMWLRPRELWLTRPATGEGGRFTYWENGRVNEDEYYRICRLMRDVHANKAVAMNIGLLNFQYAIQQGVRYYFGASPYILTDAHRTIQTNASIENAAHNSQHIHAAANDGHYANVSVSDLFKLASWFGVGGVGIYPRHVHVDAGKYRRWAGSYSSRKWGNSK